MKKISIALTLILLLCSVMVFSQEMKPEKFSNVKWYQMVMVKYKTEKLHIALSFIEKYFIPVDKEIGRKIINFDMPFGDWDKVTYFPLEGGLEELNYKTPPGGIKWMTAFVKQQGGQENAMKLLNEFESFIESSKTALVRQTE